MIAPTCPRLPKRIISPLKTTRNGRPATDFPRLGAVGQASRSRMPKTGRIRVSGYDERIVGAMEELVHFSVLMRSHAAQLADRYSERTEAGIPVGTATDHSAIAIAPQT